MSGGTGHGTILTPASHAAIDQTRISRQTDIGPKTQSFCHTGTKTFQQHIGALHQLEHGFNAGITLKVYCDALAASGEHIVLVGVLTLRALSVNANYLCTHIRQHHAAKGSGANALKLYHS